jgi:hypothetical protein
LSRLERFEKAVQRETAQLRIILEAVEAKTKERVWLKKRAQGELDENLLVDGLSGEKVRTLLSKN